MKRIRAILKQMKRDGSTFIETLIAVTILMYVIAGVLSMTTVQLKTNFNQINHTRAVKLAEEGLERKMREDFDTMAGESQDFDTIAEFPQYSRTIRVTTLDPDNKEIVVNVTWQERSRAGIDPIQLRFRRTR